MSNTDRELVAELRVILTRQRYSPVAAGNTAPMRESSLTTLRGGASRSEDSMIRSGVLAQVRFCFPTEAKLFCQFAFALISPKCRPSRAFD